MDLIISDEDGKEIKPVDLKDWMKIATAKRPKAEKTEITVELEKKQHVAQLPRKKDENKRRRGNKPPNGISGRKVGGGEKTNESPARNEENARGGDEKRR